MAPSTRSLGGLRILYILFAVTFAIPLTAARPNPVVLKRGLFSKIGHFFSKVNTQVDMTIFPPVEHLFTDVVSDVNNAVIQPAKSFFLKGGTLIVDGVYDITTLVGDIGNAIETDVIDEIKSVENLVVKISQNVNADVNKVASDITTEFNNVITPALSLVGQDIGQGLSEAGGDILKGLEAAGQFIENHPELVAEIFLTVALTAVTAVQPELVGVDGALVGDVVTEAAADAAGNVAEGLASDAVEGVSSSIVEDGADEVVNEADKTLFQSISQSLDKFTGEFNNVKKILDLANDANSTLADVASVLPVTSQTISDIQSVVGPLANATSGASAVYGQFDEVLGNLNKAGKILALVARDVPALEARNNFKARASKSSTPKPTSLKTSSNTTSSAIKTIKATASNIPLPILTQWVQHHFLNETTGGKLHVQQQLIQAFSAQLSGSNMTFASLKASSQLPTVISKVNSTLSFPPSASSHRQAISHQIATGSAIAFNAQNVTVQIQVNGTES